MALITVLKWDPAPGVFAWKYPSQELGTWAQLIVSESQEAFLFKEGQIIGPFGAGRHKLDTDNYPVLTSIIKAAVTKDSPFTAEVWFIKKSFKLDLNWGTPSAIQLEDPRYHVMLPVRAFGQYGITVSDSTRFLYKLVGTLPAFVEKTISAYIRGIIITKAKDVIAKYLIEKQISILHVSAYLSEISQIIEGQVSEELETYGLKVVNFNVNSITTDDNDPTVKKLKETLAAKLEMDLLGYNYQQKRSFDTMEAAASNPGGENSAMGMGMGMGMGVGFGMPMGNAAYNMAQNFQFGNQNVSKTCPSCGHSAAGNVQYCPSCGKSMTEIPDNFTECDKCHHKNPKGAKFCSNCGDLFFCCPQCGADNPENAPKCIKCGTPMPQKCTNCGKSADPGLKFCPECGTKLQKNCLNCGSPLTAGLKFCPECGTQIN